MNIYLDGVFDLFHVGHLRSFKYVKEHYKNCKLYIGVVCDKDVEGYKRKPIINEEQRCEIIEGIASKKLLKDCYFICKNKF